MSLQGVLPLLFLLFVCASFTNDLTAMAPVVAGYTTTPDKTVRFDLFRNSISTNKPVHWSGGCNNFISRATRSWTPSITRKAFPSSGYGDDCEIGPASLQDDETYFDRMRLDHREQHALTMQEQAQKLRAEADAMRDQLEKEKEDKVAKRKAKVDSWIEQLLIEVQVNNRTQLLKTEEQVLLRLQDGRFSQEQINAIFDRICEFGPQSRSNCSPLMELLVDSVGKMDEVDRRENPNKRWSGKVERLLRRRLFAMDWNMDIEDRGEDDDLNPWRCQ